MMGGACLSVCLSVLRPNSRTPKIGRMEAYHTGNPWTYLEVKVKVTMPINVVIVNAAYAGRGITIFLKISLL